MDEMEKRDDAAKKCLQNLQVLGKAKQANRKKRGKDRSWSGENEKSFSRNE